MHGLIAAALRRAGGVDVISHDLGAWVAHALASAYPSDVRRRVLSEVTILRSGSSQPIPDDAANVKAWHFAFNRLPGLPEALVGGHERVSLDYLFDSRAKRPALIDASARTEQVSAFSTPGAAAAGFD